MKIAMILNIPRFVGFFQLISKDDVVESLVISSQSGGASGTKNSTKGGRETRRRRGERKAEIEAMARGYIEALLHATRELCVSV
jgi:hypothetical protein